MQVPNHALVYIYVYYIENSINVYFGIIDFLVATVVVLINVNHYLNANIISYLTVSCHGLSLVSHFNS